MQANKGRKRIPSDASLEKPGSAEAVTERGNWASHVEFLLSCIGYAVGLGNIWRFPYLCMRNGGGAFLIPYFFCLLMFGVPLFFLEVVIGQFSNLSPLTVWRICPLFRGLGWGAVLLSVICTLYYNTIITWVLYYLGRSLARELPWASCGNEWNSETCYRRGNVTYLQNTSLPDVNFNTSEVPLAYPEDNSSAMTSGDEYWQYNVLQRSAGIDEIGGVRWELFACLCVAWFIIFLCLIKGIKSSGKVVYVTATAPYVFLFILLIRGVTLPGSMMGIKYYLTPDWNRLLTLKTWVEACLQIFYSLGPGWGGIITMASYSKFHNNCLRDSIIIPLVNCGTSFFAGFVIFSIIGFMAYEAQVDVPDVITSGPGLAFVAYPEALSRLPVSPVWSVFFFTMLLTVGLDSQFGMLETVLTGVCDEYPRLMRFKMILTIIFCFIGLALGTIFVTRAGVYFFQIVDWYVSIIALPVITFLECIVVSYIYGVERLYGDIKMMIGYRPSFVWKILWGGVTPAFILMIFTFSLYHTAPPTYGDYIYPGWAIAMGWSLSGIVAALPIFAIHALYKQKGSFLQRLKASVQPDPCWGPASADVKHEYERQNEMTYMPPSGDKYKMVPEIRAINL